MSRTDPPEAPPGARAGSAATTRPPRIAFVLVAGFLSVLALSLLALLTRAPLIFPSLGATAFLLWSSPETPAASPRNALCGHGIAILCGWGALLLTGLVDAPPANVAGVDLARALAAALALGATGAFMVFFDTPHAPAGATALIVSLGLVPPPIPGHLFVVQGAVALLVLLALFVHRVLGRDYPLWSRRRAHAGAAPDGRAAEAGDAAVLPVGIDPRT